MIQQHHIPNIARWSFLPIAIGVGAWIFMYRTIHLLKTQYSKKPKNPV